MDNETKLAQEVKRLKQEGYRFETAKGSLRVLEQKFSGQFKPLFDLKHFNVAIVKDSDKPCQALATIKIAVKGKEEITAANGYGPVSALDNALRKCLIEFYPKLSSVLLRDYVVHDIPSGHSGTASKVRVIINSSDGEDIWGTVGVSTDIIEASWLALVDSYQYKFSKGG